MTTIVSLDRRFVFIHVPKNGGISISETLQRDAPLHPLNVKIVRSIFQAIKKTNVFDPFRFTSKIMIPEHADIAAVEDTFRMNLSDFFVFGAIRNPWDREISNYVFITKHMRSRYYKTAFWNIRNSSFSEYLKILQERAEQSKFRQQIDFFKNSNGQIVLSDYIRLETIDADYARIAERLNLSTRALPHLNKSKRSSTQEWYDAEGIEIIRRIYADDIARFDYEFPR